MKKHIVLATGLAVLSTSAFATKSRMAAMGQDAERGSHYIKDTRSIFRNAAHVNTFKNYIVTEWGDESADDNAEGGFFREMGSFTYGLYLGSEINNQNGAKSGTGYTFQEQDNRTQLFMGGDMGVQWGASLYYANSKNEPAGSFESKNTAFGLGLGAIFGDIEGYANIDISDESEGNSAAGGVAGDKWEADLGLDLGVSYAWNNWTFFGEYSKTGYEATVGGTKGEVSNDSITVGAGYIHEVSSTARIFGDLSFVMETEETKPQTATEGEDESTSLPLTFGFETDATSWLTLRGAISQNIIVGSTEEKRTGGTTKTTDADSTTVTAGGTLTFGKLMVDGSIGTTGSGAANSGDLRLDEVFTNVAVHYWF